MVNEIHLQEALDRTGGASSIEAGLMAGMGNNPNLVDVSTELCQIQPIKL